MGTISFYNHQINPDLKDRLLLKTFLTSIFAYEKVTFKSVKYIFCTDEYLLTLNKQYLNHDTLTDILTFLYSDKLSPVISEIYISVERVKENTQLLKTDYKTELLRVMIHGILHLCGYEDKAPKQKREMRAREDFYINKF